MLQHAGWAAAVDIPMHSIGFVGYCRRVAMLSQDKVPPGLHAEVVPREVCGCSCILVRRLL